MITATLAIKVFQIGYVVPDLTAATAFFKKNYAVPNFLEVRGAGLSDQTYRGGPGNCRYNIAFGYFGDLQIELIEPVSGESTYKEFLQRNPQGGAQHIGVLVDEFDTACAELQGKGYEIVQSGRNGKTRIAYFDTDRSVGTLTELVYLDPPDRERFQRLKRGEA